MALPERVSPTSWAPAAQVPSLQSLACDRCRLSGQLPPVAAGLSSLQHLALRSNRLSGSFVVHGLNRLQHLHLDRNSLNTSLVMLTSADYPALQNLTLSHNLIVGKLPASISGRPLVCLNLAYNQLTGQLEPSWGVNWVPSQEATWGGPAASPMPLAKTLQELQLQGNPGLWGPIPNQWSGLQALQCWSVSGTSLCGDVPSQLVCPASANTSIGGSSSCPPAGICCRLAAQPSMLLLTPADSARTGLSCGWPFSALTPMCRPRSPDCDTWITYDSSQAGPSLLVSS
jgi:hypothetical protein